MFAYMAKKTLNTQRSEGVNEEQGSELSHTTPGRHTTTADLLYADAFKRVARRYNVVLGIRMPNPLGRTLLNEGYPSKNFHMKAKSSQTGPTAGFITEDPIYSKISPSSYPKQSDYIASAVKKGAVAIDLRISKERIKELISSGHLMDTGNGHYYAEYPSGRQQFIINDEGEVFDEKFNPVRVMTNPPESGSHYADPRPITADYDLFSIIPSVNQSVNIRPLTASPKLLRGNFKHAFLKPRGLPGQSEDVNMGNLHFFGMTIIQALNKEIAAEGYKGGKLVWHNDETGNPFSPGFDIADRPLFIHPAGYLIQVHSKAELLDFYAQLRRENYAPEYSPVFGF